MMTPRGAVTDSLANLAWLTSPLTFPGYVIFCRHIKVVLVCSGFAGHPSQQGQEGGGGSIS